MVVFKTTVLCLQIGKDTNLEKNTQLLYVLVAAVNVFQTSSRHITVVSEIRILHFQMHRDVSGRRRRRILLLAGVTRQTEINLNRILNSLPVQLFKRAVISLLLLREEKKYCCKKNNYSKLLASLLLKSSHIISILGPTCLVIITSYLKSPFVIWIRLKSTGEGCSSKFRMGGCHEGSK